MPAGLRPGCARRPMRGDPRGRTLASMSKHIAAVVGLIVVGACGPRITYLAVRDDATAPGHAAAGSTVIALSNGRYLTLAPDSRGSASSAARWRFRPELSYRPANAVDAGPFVHLDFYVMRPGSEAEAEALS